jgi:protein-tyrosine-phosphatase
VGQESLAKDGEILTAFQHQRVHEGGGGSSYRKSVPIDDRMLACSARMLAHLRWTGVAMVEYRWNETTGEFALMEINGRFWGSLPLAVAAGVDFPADLYALLVEGRRPEPRPYRAGIYCRNLVKDVDWYRARRRADPKDPYLVRVPESRTLDQLTNLLRGAEHSDTSTVDDPFPGLVEIGFLLRAQVRKVAKALWRTAWGVVAATPWWRRRERTRLRELVAMRPQLLFVCKGNVCRSPFAETYARAASARVGLQLALASVGTHRAEGRSAPEGAQAASLELGVSLGQHRSRMLTSERAQSAGALVCMDWQTHDRVVESFPEAAEKLFLLGPFARKLRGLEIGDPWGQPVDAFRRCYREIVAGVDAMLEALKETR